MGAKLISSLKNNNQISKNDAIKLFSICSVSGPMFIIGTVGIGIFNNYKIGIIILLSNILACLFNGLLYRKGEGYEKIYISKNRNTFSLADCVYDSLISILIVGAYIVLSFLIIDIVKNFSPFQNMLQFIGKKCNNNNLPNIVNALFSCFMEITCGCIDISNTTLSLEIKTIIASFSIAFGGISIMLQSLNFLSHSGIPFKTFFKIKLTQAVICFLIATPLCILFM